MVWKAVYFVKAFFHNKFLLGYFSSHWKTVQVFLANSGYCNKWKLTISGYFLVIIFCGCVHDYIPYIDSGPHCVWLDKCKGIHNRFFIFGFVFM
jgi:hypothetical protein